MDRTILHIGYHRTGSTFLQQQVFPSLPVNQVIKPDVVPIVEREQFDDRAWLAEVHRQFTIDPQRPTIISHEMLSGSPEGGPVARRDRIATRLKQLFPTARVVIVVRNQPDYVLSIYGYRVLIRGLESRSIDGYLDGQTDLLESLQYDRLVAHYMELFGRERVLVLPYEQLAREPTAFLGTLASFMGVEVPQIAARRVNESTRSGAIVGINRALNFPLDATFGALRRNGLITHRTYLRVTRPYFTLKERVLNPALRRWVTDTTRLQLPESWLTRIEPTLAESNRRLERLASLDLGAYGYLV